MLPLVNGLLSFTKLNYSRLLLTDEIHMLVLMNFILHFNYCANNIVAIVTFPLRQGGIFAGFKLPFSK